MNYTEYYLAHHGIKGQKWGVRRFQNPDGTLTPAGKKRKKIIDKEIDFQNRKIEQYERTAKAYRDSAAEVRKSGVEEAMKAGYDRKTAQEAVNVVVKRRENEARWNEHIAEHLRGYNKKLSELDITDVNMGKFKIHMYIQTLGEQTRNEINRTWKEDE